MYLAILGLPILGSTISGFLGRKVGVTGAQLITTICVNVTAILAFFAFLEIGFNNLPVHIDLFTWIDSETLEIVWAFNYDSLTVSMLIPVLTVSSLVHLYSWGYMSHDPHIQRFMSYLSLFTFMMIMLVTADSYLVMFVGWEGVGICSYLLVSFWFTRIAANQSSLSALLVNRVGDCFLTIGMFTMLSAFGNIDYATVFCLAPYMNQNTITIVGVCLLIGAMAKSSQLGLHVWLPQAMEGPTPVSALIHAATMVTAGVYLLMRSSPLIEYSSTVLGLALWLGGFTTVFSSLVGLYQQDIKKVIAYSTMSQLGMMVIAIGLSSYTIALFHLVNHAFYKALLFLAAGSVIHSVSDNQDFRKYGGLASSLPLTYSVMFIASLSLVAFPFMTGFYSKDLILESLYAGLNYSSSVIYFIATIGAMFTTLYSVKVLHLTFLASPAGPSVDYKNVHESDIYMSLPLIILAVFSIYFGFLSKDIFIGLGSGFFSDNALYIHPSHETFLDTEFAVPSLTKLLPLFFTIAMIILGIVISEFYPKSLLVIKLSTLGYIIFSLFNQRFYIELFYNRYVTDGVLNAGGQTTKVLDKGSVELIGPYGLENGLGLLSKAMATLDTGVITTYAMYIFVGLISYLLVPFIGLTSMLVITLIALLSIIDSSVAPLKFNRYSEVGVQLHSSFLFVNLDNMSTLYSMLDGLNIENIPKIFSCLQHFNIDILPKIFSCLQNLNIDIIPKISCCLQHLNIENIPNIFSSLQHLNIENISNIFSCFTYVNLEKLPIISSCFTDLNMENISIFSSCFQILNLEISNIVCMSSNTGSLPTFLEPPTQASGPPSRPYADLGRTRPNVPTGQPVTEEITRAQPPINDVPTGQPETGIEDNGAAQPSNTNDGPASSDPNTGTTGQDNLAEAFNKSSYR